MNELVKTDCFENELFLFIVESAALLFYKSDHLGAGEDHSSRENGGHGDVRVGDEARGREVRAVDLELCQLEIGHVVRVGFVWVGD